MGDASRFACYCLAWKVATVIEFDELSGQYVVDLPDESGHRCYILMSVFALLVGYVFRTVLGYWVSPGWLLLRASSAVFAGGLLLVSPGGALLGCDGESPRLFFNGFPSSGILWGTALGTVRVIPHIGHAESSVDSRMGSTLQWIFLWGKYLIHFTSFFN